MLRESARLAAEATFFLCLLALLLLAGYHVYELLGGAFIVGTVATRSMEPDFPAGSLVLVKRVYPDEVAVGEVAAYSYPQSPRYTLFHRVVGVEGDNLVIKGDAVQNIDLVPRDRVHGVYVLGAPHVGSLRAALAFDPLLAFSVASVLLVLYLLRGELKHSEKA